MIDSFLIYVSNLIKLLSYIYLSNVYYLFYIDYMNSLVIRYNRKGILITKLLNHNVPWVPRPTYCPTIYLLKVWNVPK